MFMLHHGIGIDTGFYTVSKYISTTAALLVIYIYIIKRCLTADDIPCWSMYSARMQ